MVIEGDGIAIADHQIEVLGTEAAVAGGIGLGKEAEAGHAAGGGQVQWPGVTADEEGEAAGKAGQLAQAAEGNLHVAELGLGIGWILELDQQGGGIVAAQIPEQSLPLGQGEPLALAGTGEKADERPFRVVLPERQQPWAGAVQQAAELNLIGEMTVHAEQLQRLVGVVAVIVGSEGLGEQGIPLGIVKAQLLAGLYPAGDEVIGAGGKGHIDPIVMLTAQSPQHRQGG